MNCKATISLESAAATAWDVVVVGAGPGGSLAARELARRDLRVLLVDKATFPRFKVCGGCLNRRSMALLESVGLGQLPGQLGGRPIEGIDLFAGSRSARIRLAGGVSISREQFDAALVTEAIVSGASFLPAVRVVDTTCLGETRNVQCQSHARKENLSARVVIASHGLNAIGDPTAWRGETAAGSRIGAGVIACQQSDTFPSEKITMMCGQHGYVGAVRLEDARVGLAAALDPVAVKRTGGLGNAVAAIVAETTYPDLPWLADLPWVGTPLLTRSPGHVAAERIFFIGDAAGYVEPFTGEGIAWALSTGREIVPIVQQATKCWQQELPALWTRTHRQIIRRRQWLIRTVASVLRRSSLTKLMVAALAISPIPATPITSWLDRLPPASNGKGEKPEIRGAA
ncbi:MAG: FAD-dependent monooxygenase [Planctomycetales bacterium]